MSQVVPRYLVPFHPKRIPHHFVDVLVIGGGIAGLRAAMEIDPRLSVLVITKDTMEQSNSAYAQGGIATVIDPEDRFEDHVTDTMVAGANLCDREVVEMVVREAPEHIQRADRLGHAVRRRERPLAVGPRRRAQPSPDRPRAGRRNGPRSDAGHDRPCQAGTRRPVLAEDVYDRPAHQRRLVLRRAGLERRPRQDVRLGQANDPLHRRGRPDLPRNDEPRRGHRRRSRDRLSRRGGAPRHGVHAVPSDGALHRRLAAAA